MADLQMLVEELGKLTLVEASKLVKMLEEAWGVTAAAPMMAGMMMPMGGSAEAAAPVVEVEEQTEFDVILTSGGDKKINVIKEVRKLNAALGLKEAKDAVDSTPYTVLTGVSKEAAAAAKAALSEAGATVEVK